MDPNGSITDRFVAGSRDPIKVPLRHKTTAAQAKIAEDGPNNPFTDEPLSPKYFDMLEERRKLSVHAQRDNFLQIYQSSQMLLSVGETGTGKTTQIPQFVLFDNLFQRPQGGKQVACTQPRRIAAMSAAQRVAEEMDVRLGEEVGYRIRFEDKTSNKTLLKYMTDGMLLREAISDPDLNRYGAIIVDEAHERTVATDVLMALLKGLVKRRNDMRVVIMSATLDAAKFSKYFDNAPLLLIPGRVHPVDIFYTRRAEKDYLEAAVWTVLRIHASEPEGDILLFLTGEEEIENACREIRNKVDQMTRELDVGRLVCHPLYATLPPFQQHRIHEKAPGPSRLGGKPGRKCVIATNIAETSLTIDGIVYVVDPGFSKQKVYDPRVRIESLLVSPISKAAAEQRAGRAGRTCPGKCFRLYSEEAFNKILIEQAHPAILCSNLSSTILELKRLGVNDLVHFDFMDPPAPETLMRGLKELVSLKCLDEEGELTHIGLLSSEFPLHPALAVMLISSPDYCCSNEILSIASLLSAPQIFVRPADKHGEADNMKARFAYEGSDHITLLKVYHAFQQSDDAQVDPEQWCHDHYVNHASLQEADNIRTQLGHIMEHTGLELVSTPFRHKDDFQNIRRALLSGFFTQVAKKDPSKNVYRTLDDRRVLLHPSTVLQGSEWVVYHECILTRRSYIRTVTAIDPTWLLDYR